MKYLNKIFPRFLISLVLGSFSIEFYVLMTGNNFVHNFHGLIWIPTIIIFLLFTLLVAFQKYKYYFFDYDNQKSSKEIRDDILDEEIE